MEEAGLLQSSSDVLAQISIGNPHGLCQDFVKTSMLLRNMSVFGIFGVWSFLMQFLDQFGSRLRAFGETVAMSAS